MSELSFRRATLDDLDFVTAAIVEADRSGAERGAYERVFDLSRGELSALLGEILRADVPGSELCCGSFLLALEGGVPVGGIATWIEADGEPPSSVVRANLLAYTLGAERWAEALPRLRLLGEVDLERARGAVQIEAMYVLDARRGRRIAPALIARTLADHRAARPELAESGKAQLLSSLAYVSSHHAAVGAGFRVAREARSDRPEVVALLPSAGRILWERPLA